LIYCDVVTNFSA